MEEKVSSYKKLLKNSSIFAIANLGTKIISLLLVPYYTFVLSTEEYGSVDLIVTTISLIIPIITLSIFDSVLRFAMDMIDKREEIFSSAFIAMIIGFILSLLLLPLVKLIPSIYKYVGLFYSIILIQSIHILLSNFIRAIGKIKLFALDGVFNTIVLLTSNIILLTVFNYGIKGYLISILVSHIMSCMFILLFGKVLSYIKFNKYDNNIIKEMLLYSIPLIPNALMWWVMNVSDRYIITIFLGYTANGLYAIANKIPGLLNIVNSIFFQAWQLSAIEESNSKTKSNFYTNVFNIFATTMLLVTSILVLIIKPMIRLMVSSEYQECWKYTPFLLLGIVFSSFSSFLGTNYIAMKKTNGVFKTSIIGAIINIILNIITIPIIGINGAAISTMISFLVVWILRIKDTKEYVNISINKRGIVNTLFIIGIQISVLFVEIKFDIFIQLILFIIIILININYIKQLVKKIY